jgi:hypothetical protein
LFVQTLPYIAQSADKCVREAVAQSTVSIGYRRILEGILSTELQSIRSDAVLLSDYDPSSTIGWWAAHGSKTPLLHSLAKVAIITPIATIDVERAFSSLGKHTP